MNSIEKVSSIRDYKPIACPFCGFDGEIKAASLEYTLPKSGESFRHQHEYLVKIGCSNPECLIYIENITSVFPSRKIALMAWNTRFPRSEHI